MSLRHVQIKVGAAVAVVALAASACSSSGNDAAGGGSPPPSAHHAVGGGSDGSAAASAAAGLRAALDELFHEHVNLTGFTVQTAVITGIDSPNTAAALKALDGNTVALGKAIGSIYGDPAEQAFLKMWRAHIGFFVNYTKGLATNDKALVTKSQQQLAGYQRQFGKFLGTATGVPSAAVSADLQGHITTLEAAIRAIVTKDPSAADKLQMAAMHMDGTAAALASGIASQQGLAGSADGDAATLRAGLTGLLVQHVAQTVVVVQTAVETSLASLQTGAAVQALDDNTLALGKAIGSIYGDAAQQAFLKMWRAHIGFFVSYTKGLAGSDDALVNKAENQLAGYQQQFGMFLGTATGLPASAVSADLQGHISTLEAAIRAILTKDPSAAAKVSEAQAHMAGTAAVLAGAIAEQQNLS
jgi:hypothetical protein